MMASRNGCGPVNALENWYCHECLRTTSHRVVSETVMDGDGHSVLIYECHWCAREKTVTIPLDKEKIERTIEGK
jgi:hypothetical protein